MALIQFLLGVDAPVSLLLLQQIFITVLVNTLIALPVYALVRRVIQPGAARRSAPPPPPRLHDRRPQPAAAPVRAARPDPALLRPSQMIQPPEDRAPAADAAAGAAGRDRRQRRAGAVRDHLLPPVVPAGAVGQPVPGPGAASTASATSRSRARAARSSTAAATCWSTAKPGARGPDLAARAAGRAGADDAVAQPPRRDTGVYRRLAQVLGMSTKRQRVHGSTAYGVAAPGSPIACEVAQQLRAAALRQRDDQDRRLARTSSTTSPSARTSSRASASSRSTLRRYPLNTLAAQLFGTVGPITPQEVKRRALPRASRRTRSSASPGSSGTTTGTCAASTATDRVQVDALGHFSGLLSATTPPRGPQPEAVARHRRCRGPGRQALPQSIDDNPPATAGAFVAMNPADGEVYAMGSLPTFNPNIFTKPMSHATYQHAEQRRQRLPAAQPRDPERRADRVDVQADHRDRGAAERRLERRRDLRRHRPVLRRPGQCRHNAGHAANGVLDLVDAIRVSSDVFFYNLGALLNVDPIAHRTAARSSTGRACSGSGSNDRDRPRRRDRGQPADARRGARRIDELEPSVAASRQAPRRPAAAESPTAATVVGRRQHQPRGRPGRRPGHAAAARGRLLGDRQRRHGRAPAHRARDRARRTAPCCRRSTRRRRAT